MRVRIGLALTSLMSLDTIHLGDCLAGIPMNRRWDLHQAKGHCERTRYTHLDGASAR